MVRRLSLADAATTIRRLGGVLLLAAIVATTMSVGAEEEPAAVEVLADGQKAFEARDFNAATTSFRDFLKRFPKHADSDAVRYRLAFCLLELPTPDFGAAGDLLQPLTAAEKPNRTAALFGLGVVQRGLGMSEILKGNDLKEAVRRQIAARPHFEQAVLHFAAAARSFRERVKNIPADRPLPPDLDWSAQAQALQAEMLLRLGQPKEAAALLEPLLKEPWLTRSACASRVAYYEGYAQTLLGNRLAAGRAFGRLRPFTEPDFGPPAAYFLGRLQQQDDERAEAALLYRAALKNEEIAPEADAAPKLEAPDHVGRSAFFLATLEYEAGHTAAAHDLVVDFAKRFPRTPLAAEARLLQGACEVQLGRPTDAVATLQPLTNSPPALRGAALLWLGKAQASVADPEDAEATKRARERAALTLRQAYEVFNIPASATADSRARRGEILLTLADLLQAAGQHAQAATLFGQLIDEKLTPLARDELFQRQVTALTLARDYAASEKVAAQFLATYPRSPFAPEVHFRHAENGVFLAQADRAAADRLTKDASRGFQLVIERFPETPVVNPAHYALGWIHYQAGEFDKAREHFEAVPASDRVGDLAPIAFLIADCLIRVAPEQADDAIAQARLQETLRGAADLLLSLVAEQVDGPLAPDALLRVGMCQQRLAEALSGEERNQALAAARSAFERVLLEYPGNELAALAAVERARCIVRQGDPNEAARVLATFKGEALRTNPVAPLAILQRATLLRGMENQAVVASRELAAARREQEKLAAKDPTRTGLVRLLRQQHALALKDANQFAAARGLLDLVRKEAADRPEGWLADVRWGQCLHDEAVQALDKANQTLGMDNVPPADRAAAEKQAAAARDTIRQALRHHETLADRWKQNPKAAAARARALYEAVWIYRRLAAEEVEAVTHPPGEDVHPHPVPLPGDPPVRVALQPSEKKVRELYRELIATAAETPLGQAAYLELAEVHAERNELAAAVPLLKQLLDKEPSPELTSQARLRLGGIALAQGDLKTAQTQFATAAADPTSPLGAQAAYRSGECLVQQQRWQEAVNQLVPFRDQENLQNVGGVSDAALLRLGHSYAHLKDWAQAKETHKALVARFAGSPWAPEAFYGIGQARQQLKNFDGAQEAYGQAIASGKNEAAARAQLGMGLCKVEQKQYEEAMEALEAAANNYPYPEIGAFALLEAAHAAARLKQKEQTERLLQQLLEKYPQSAFAEKARKSLKMPKELTDAPHMQPAAVAVLTPTLPPALALDALGEQIPDDNREDPTVELTRTLILVRRPVTRAGAAAPIHWEVADPFAHRLFFPVPPSLPEDGLPTILRVGLPPG